MKPSFILTVLLLVPFTAVAGPELTMTKAQFERAQKQKIYRFDGYPTKNAFNGKTAKLNMKDHYARTFRTRLREVLAENRPNAAGKYSTFGFGCGTSGCIEAGAIDNTTGTPIQLGDLLLGCGNSDEDGDFRSDPKSNLIIASGCLEGHLKDKDGSEQFGHHYFLIDKGKFKHLRSVRVEK